MTHDDDDCESPKRCSAGAGFCRLDRVHAGSRTSRKKGEKETGSGKAESSWNGETGQDKWVANNRNLFVSHARTVAEEDSGKQGRMFSEKKRRPPYLPIRTAARLSRPRPTTLPRGRGRRDPFIIGPNPTRGPIHQEEATQSGGKSDERKCVPPGTSIRSAGIGHGHHPHLGLARGEPSSSGIAVVPLVPAAPFGGTLGIGRRGRVTAAAAVTIVITATTTVISAAAVGAVIAGRPAVDATGRVIITRVLATSLIAIAILVAGGATIAVLVVARCPTAATVTATTTIIVAIIAARGRTTEILCACTGQPRSRATPRAGSHIPLLGGPKYLPGVGVLGRARRAFSMLKVLPSITSPWRPSLAASACSAVTILTKPKPRDSFV